MAKRAALREAWHPPPYEKADVLAIQSLASGTASETEQSRALQWIVNVAAGTYDEPFRAGQSDVRDYLLGRRSVGLAIVKLMKLNTTEIFKDE